MCRIVNLRHNFVILSLTLCAAAAFSDLYADEPQAVSPQKKALWQAMLMPIPNTASKVHLEVMPPKQVATLFGEPIMSDEPRIISGKIMAALFEKYGKERGVTVSDEEAAHYAAILKKGEKHWEKQQADAIKELKEALASGTLTQPESDLARRRIEQAERRAQNTTELDEQEQTRIWNQVVRPILQNYKIYQQLYRDYGGRVAFQQMGMEPVDAIHDFLKSEQEKGSFSFNDPAAERAFWNYFTITPHFYLKDEKEIHKFMNTSWWLEPPAKQDNE